MKHILKYPVRIEDEFAIEMPSGSTLLSVQIQNGVPQLWALVEVGAPMARRKLAIRGTGHDLTFSAEAWPAKYVGTFQMQGGSLAWHLFDLGEPWPVS